MSAPGLTLLAPAKLNLFLHITGRRADGYHELQTLFQLLDYGDTMNFIPRKDDTIVLHIKPGPFSDGIPRQDNLVIRAIDALRPLRLDLRDGIEISLEKRIPPGGGLGGGSANAAMTLLALNSLWELHLDPGRLAQIGLGLGADVPLFLHGHSAWAEGVGERLQDLELARRWYLVATPRCQVNTGLVFSQENLTRNSPTIKIADFLAAGTRNDCESVTRTLYPEVDAALNCLSRYGSPRMSGTGASVFLDFPDEASAAAVLAELPGHLHGFVARGVNTLEQKLAGA